MEKKGTVYGPIKAKSLEVHEAALDYQGSRKQGEYTLEDYYALREKKRVELIDGVIYNMAAPGVTHQRIIGEMFAQLNAYIDEKHGACIPLFAPCSVQLDQDDRTMVEPDIMIVCKRDLIRERAYFGAPDFIAEILSPSTRDRDTRLKLWKYRNAGVREYWIVDPENKVVTVYDFEHGSFPTAYGFGDQVPVNIFGGNCVVDFAKILERTQFLYERTDDYADS